MKRITHKCPCGAEGSFETQFDAVPLDLESTWMDQWSKSFLASHTACRQAKPEPQAKETGPSDLVFCDSCKDLCLRDELTIAYQSSEGLQILNCQKCMEKRKLNTEPKPDPDECADRRTNRANSLAEDCSPTKEGARKHAELLASQQPGVFHFYHCNVGGKEHWHVEQIEADSIVANRGYHWYHVDQIEQWEKAARQQERERIRKIIKDAGYQSNSGCCVEFAFKTIERLLIAIESGAE